MEPYHIVVTGWGVFITIQTPLRTGDRDFFLKRLSETRDHVLGMENRGVFIDLRKIDIENATEGRVRAYVNIADLFHAQRIAVTVASAGAAARLSATLSEARLLDISRIFVPRANEKDGLTAALQWVENGIDAELRD